MKKPLGSTVAKQASSARPGFHPSAAAQFRTSGISSVRMVRMVRLFMVALTSLLHRPRRTPLLLVQQRLAHQLELAQLGLVDLREMQVEDRKSTRLNSSHMSISYAV